MKYDDASWHSGGDFPADLRIAAGATHGGVFVAWALLSGLAGEIHIDDLPEGVEALASRSTTPGAFYLKFCDGKFTDEDLDEEGKAFAAAYFDFESGRYIADYEAPLAAGLPSCCHVEDNWQKFDFIRPVLDGRLADLRAQAGSRLARATPWIPCACN